MAIPSLREIQAANASVNDNGYLLLTLTRPVGPYLAWLWIRLGLTPRQINYLSIVFGLLLLALAATGGRGNLIAATALCFVWQAIDVSDGTMARALVIRDNFGGFVDYSSGMLIVAFLPLCLGLGAYAGPDGSLAALASILFPKYRPEPALIIAVGATISVISLYMRLINRVLQIRFGASLSDPEKGNGDAGKLRWLRNILKNVETVGGVQVVIFFVGTLAGVLEAVLFLYLLLYVVLIVAFAASVYRTYGHRRAYL
jgi:phosphatidylglycerophosphate synthase